MPRVQPLKKKEEEEEEKDNVGRGPVWGKRASSQMVRSGTLEARMSLEGCMTGSLCCTAEIDRTL